MINEGFKILEDVQGPPGNVALSCICFAGGLCGAILGHRLGLHLWLWLPTGQGKECVMSGTKRVRSNHALLDALSNMLKHQNMVTAPVQDRMSKHIPVYEI